MPLMAYWSPVIFIVPISEIFTLRSMVLYPMQVMRMMAVLVLHGMTKCPFSLLTPPVMNVESAIEKS